MQLIYGTMRYFGFVPFDALKQAEKELIDLRKYSHNQQECIDVLNTLCVDLGATLSRADERAAADSKKLAATSAALETVCDRPRLDTAYMSVYPNGKSRSCALWLRITAKGTQTEIPVRRLAYSKANALALGEIAIKINDAMRPSADGTTTPAEG